MAIIDLRHTIKTEAIQSNYVGIFQPYSIEIDDYDYGSPEYGSTYIHAKGDASYKNEESSFNVRYYGSFNYSSDKEYLDSKLTSAFSTYGKWGTSVLRDLDIRVRDILGDEVALYEKVLRGDDVIYGSNFTDLISAKSGDDLVYGGSGNDWIYGEDGNDRLYGGHGSDHLEGRKGDDKIFGDAGDDVIKYESGDDEIDGGSGTDLLMFDVNSSEVEVSLSGSAYSFRLGRSTIQAAGIEFVQFSDKKLEISELIDFGKSSSYLEEKIVSTSTWRDSIRINLDKTGSTSDSVIQAKQVDKSEYDFGFVGSIVNGTSDDDIVRGLAGFDQLFGKAGDDLIHGGNGRDIIDGGSGSDELHGDFGWNTFLDQQDGSKDLIAIKSDQHLSNFWYGKAGNSPNGEKADFIEGLDATDEIKIIGVFTPNISVVDNVTARGVTGIGIYAKGTLEAVYTGDNLSTSQIQNMTTGDGSTTAMNNQMWSYWGSNTVPALQS